MNELTTTIEQVVVQGDLANLSPQDRVMYYKQVCESIGLNPLTKPFDYIRLNNKLTLYAKRDATDQIRSLKGISIKIVAREKVDDLYIVTAQATDKAGRTDESVGAVQLGALKGDALANAIMKAETKAKRRVTLSIAGLGFLDETEVQSIQGAEIPNIDTSTGEIIDPLKQAIERNQDSINVIKEGIATNNISAAAEAWFELSNEEKSSIWVAPSKGGPFTTVERDVIKSKAFREAYYGPSEEQAA